MKTLPGPSVSAEMGWVLGTKIFPVRRGRHCTPRLLFSALCIEESENTAGGSLRGEMGPNISQNPLSVYYCIHRLPFCLYPRLPAVLNAVWWVLGQKYFRCGWGTVAATLYPQAPCFPHSVAREGVKNPAWGIGEG